MNAQVPKIVATVDIDAPVEVVWTYLVEEEHVPRWLGCLAYRKRIGHVFYMQPDPERREEGSVEGATHCEILALEEPRRFSFSWYLPGTPATTVTFTLESRDPPRTPSPSSARLCCWAWSPCSRLWDRRAGRVGWIRSWRCGRSDMKGLGSSG